MSKFQTTIIFDKDVLDRLDAMCVRQRRTRASQLAFMIDGWDDMEKAAHAPRSAPATRTPKEPKPEPEPLPGADGVLVYMQNNNPKNQPIGSRWLLKYPESLPPLEALPWALRPPEVCERVKVSKTNPRGVIEQCPLPVSKSPPIGPVVPHKFFAVPDDPTEPGCPLTIYAKAQVAADHRATTPKNNFFVRHMWNAALGQWVADTDDIEWLGKVGHWRDPANKLWLEQKAYGAETVEQLKELLTALAGDFNLTDDAKAFIGAGDEENEVA